MDTKLFYYKEDFEQLLMARFWKGFSLGALVGGVTFFSLFYLIGTLLGIE